MDKFLKCVEAFTVSVETEITSTPFLFPAKVTCIERFFILSITFLTCFRGGKYNDTCKKYCIIKVIQIFIHFYEKFNLDNLSSGKLINVTIIESK